MHAISDGTARSDSVKSLTLYDLAATPRRLPSPPAFQIPDLGTIVPVARIVDLARKAVMAWGLISLGAVAGMTAYYSNGGADSLLLARDAATASDIAGPQVHLAALLEIPDAPDAASTRFALPPTPAPPTRQPIAAVGAVEAPALNEPPPIVEARLPRPRPEEPIFTGSIGTPADAPYYSAPRGRPSRDPCLALRNLGAPFLFGSRCYRQSRASPPPPPVIYEPPPQRQYAPQPYQPPVIYQN